ncbi:uncharacterized protein J3R85_006518 [Psidium guajava]|nr:uncharacterized protein J3R85_006518 [Psidium guajava]
MGAVIIPQNLPVGYRFHPTDEEFVDHYLKNRVLGYVDHPCVIPDVDICRWDPWELPRRFQGNNRHLYQFDCSFDTIYLQP